jgi:DNA repair protein RadC
LPVPDVMRSVSAMTSAAKSVARPAHDLRPCPPRAVASCDGASPMADLFAPYLARRSEEAAILAGFDHVGRLVHWSECHGSNATSVHIGRSALRTMMARASIVTAIVAHNHPSGQARPSPADLAFTRDMAAMCRFCGIHLYDHLIFAAHEWYSFRREGLI